MVSIFRKLCSTLGQNWGVFWQSFEKSPHHAHGLGTPCAWSPPKVKMVQQGRGNCGSQSGGVLKKHHHAHGPPHHAHGPLKVGLCLYKHHPPSFKIISSHPPQHTPHFEKSHSLSLEFHTILEKSLRSRRSRVPKQLPTSSRLDPDDPEVFPKSEDPHLA